MDVTRDRIDIDWRGNGQVSTIALNGATIRGPVTVVAPLVDGVYARVDIHLRNVVVRHHRPALKAVWPWLVDWKRRVLGS